MYMHLLLSLSFSIIGICKNLHKFTLITYLKKQIEVIDVTGSRYIDYKFFSCNACHLITTRVHIIFVFVITFKFLIKSLV